MKMNSYEDEINTVFEDIFKNAFQNSSEIPAKEKEYFEMFFIGGITTILDVLEAMNKCISAEKMALRVHQLQRINRDYIEKRLLKELADKN